MAFHAPIIHGGPTAAGDVAVGTEVDDDDVGVLEQQDEGAATTSSNGSTSSCYPNPLVAFLESLGPDASNDLYRHVVHR